MTDLEAIKIVLRKHRRGGISDDLLAENILMAVVYNKAENILNSVLGAETGENT